MWNAKEIVHISEASGHLNKWHHVHHDALLLLGFTGYRGEIWWGNAIGEDGARLTGWDYLLPICIFPLEDNWCRKQKSKSTTKIYINLFETRFWRMAEAPCILSHSTVLVLKFSAAPSPLLLCPDSNVLLFIRSLYKQPVSDPVPAEERTTWED